MSNDAFTQQALANDPTFRQRLKASMTRIAFQVLEESSGTAGHATRASYARTFLSNPDSAINSIAGWFVFRTNVNSTTTSLAFDGRGGVVVQSAVTDAAMDSQLATDWNNLAGVSMALAIGATPATPGHQYGGASTITTSSFSPSAGSLLVAVLPWNPAGATFLSIATSNGETFTVDKSADAAATFPSCKIASLQLVNGGAQTVPATWSNGAVSSAYLFVYEVTGAATSSAFDASADGDGGIGASSVVSGTFTTAQADEIIFSGLLVYNSAPTVTAPSTPSAFTGTSYTSDNDKGYSAYLIVSAVQTGITETWTTTGGASRSEMVVATYKAASGGGGGSTNWGPWVVGGMTWNRLVQ